MASATSGTLLTAIAGQVQVPRQLAHDRCLPAAARVVLTFDLVHPGVHDNPVLDLNSVTSARVPRSRRSYRQRLPDRLSARDVRLVADDVTVHRQRDAGVGVAQPGRHRGQRKAGV